MSADHVLPAGVLEEVAGLLSTHFDRAVIVVAQEYVKSGRTSVFRLTLGGAPVETAICRYGGREETLWNELAGMRFLAQLPRPPATVPTFYAGGPVGTDKAVVLSRDIGTSPDLAEILLRGTAEQARAGLEGWVDALLEVHLATFGHRAAHDAVRAEYDPPRSFTELLSDGGFARLAEAFAKLGIGPLPAGFAEAVAWVDAQLAPDDRWWAFTVADCCPDNNQVGPDGRVTLFDLEFAGCRHALLDLSYVRTFMPTCWCLRRLPDELSSQLVARYRDRLLAARPELDEDEFEAGFAASQAFWAITTAGFQLERTLTDPKAGERLYFEGVDFAVAAPAEVVRLRIAHLTRLAAERKELAPLGELADLIAGQLEKRWPAIDLLPLYPAFDAPQV
ncbi:hypothetical protein [Tenggerimyces flavus]|uniref:Aminoglycoside phosphotransferase domain-containing protein n=1 Tax=Tenggerimyces flavus TaxID=1708749 RepID=A0ABV7Y8S9_9ACTN|nr:hypothetical protein [Tenggerimyces flavus]MBM7783706.1 hypothetical protein [Tenggerimyces flavus]